MREAPKVETRPARVMALLATLAEIHAALTLLRKNGIVREDTVAKGCKKFINDNPEINAYIGAEFR